MYSRASRNLPKAVLECQIMEARIIEVLLYSTVYTCTCRRKCSYVLYMYMHCYSNTYPHPSKIEVLVLCDYESEEQERSA